MLELIPFKRYGLFEIGMGRDLCRHVADGSFESFDNNKDAFQELGLHAHYDASESLEFLEIFEPANPSYFGIPLLESSLNKLLVEFQCRGVNTSWIVNRGILYKEGIALTSDRNGVVEAVAIFRKNYYARFE